MTILKVNNMKATQIHYQTGKDYDVIDFIKDYNINFNLGNVCKYVARAGKKDDELQDLRKALDYLQREIAYLEDAKREYVKQTIDR